MGNDINESIKEIEEQISRANVKLMVLFTTEGEILRKTCSSEKAQQIVEKSLNLLQNISETISGKYESDLTLHNLRARGEEGYLYVYVGGRVVLTLLQDVPITEEEERTLKHAKTIEEVF